MDYILIGDYKTQNKIQDKWCLPRPENEMGFQTAMGEIDEKSEGK